MQLYLKSDIHVYYVHSFHMKKITELHTNLGTRAYRSMWKSILQTCCFFCAGYNSILITDELLRLVTPIIPISEWRQIAYEALNLTVNEVDAIESTQTRADVIFHLLHQAVQRDQMPSKVLKQKIEDARAGGIHIALKGLEKIECTESENPNSFIMIHG